ncbi:hypothetical protein PYCCODRAFT_772983 [Trametes coccinea BRFM310]|uniref:Uncharacterized protein n=1 Tax=Trametes coccinea (strain BRFM310) TaxID=1353009 RepID=A0A1Y2J0B1_TRAC3|nr:hypothetical protein PYCCODRAFT_772983 [Trametes coccinea BRFM310]
MGNIALIPRPRPRPRHFLPSQAFRSCLESRCPRGAIIDPIRGPPQRRMHALSQTHRGCDALEATAATSCNATTEAPASKLRSCQVVAGVPRGLAGDPGLKDNFWGVNAVPPARKRIDCYRQLGRRKGSSLMLLQQLCNHGIRQVSRPRICHANHTRNTCSA